MHLVLPTAIRVSGVAGQRRQSRRKNRGLEVAGESQTHRTAGGQAAGSAPPALVRTCPLYRFLLSAKTWRPPTKVAIALPLSCQPMNGLLRDLDLNRTGSTVHSRLG